MKQLLLIAFLCAISPREAEALNTDDVLSLVAMPLAVSQVCDVRGVQTSRVAELVSYMNQADVPPADFVETLRYVPIALVFRGDDRQPDFVEWVHGEIGRGVRGEGLAWAMDRQLRTYDEVVPVVERRETHTARHVRYAYSYAFDRDYVPSDIRRHCGNRLAGSLSVIDMPVAVVNVCDVRGMRAERVAELAREMIDAGVISVQFCEVMRYAPAALVYDGGYRGQPDFVQYVRSERARGLGGYQLVTAIDQRLRSYDVAPQIDPYPTGQSYSQPFQNYIPPSEQFYVPPVVRTRVATRIASVGFNAQPIPAPPSAQVQRLLGMQNGQAVVVNPNQAGRELRDQQAAAERANRQAIAAASPAPIFAPGRGNENGRRRLTAVAPAPAVAASPDGQTRGFHGRRDVAAPAPVTAVRPAAPPQPSQASHGNRNGNENGNGNGRGHRAVADPVPAPAAAAAAPQPSQVAPGNGNGRGRRAFVAPAPPPAAPVAAAPPPAVQTGPVRGHGQGHQAAAAPPPAAPAPAAGAAPGPPAAVQQSGHGRSPDGKAPPGQEKKKEKGKDQG